MFKEIFDVAKISEQLGPAAGIVVAILCMATYPAVRSFISKFLIQFGMKSTILSHVIAIPLYTCVTLELGLKAVASLWMGPIIPPFNTPVCEDYEYYKKISAEEDIKIRKYIEDCQGNPHSFAENASSILQGREFGLISRCIEEKKCESEICFNEKISHLPNYMAVNLKLWITAEKNTCSASHPAVSPSIIDVAKPCANPEHLREAETRGVEGLRTFIAECQAEKGPLFLRANEQLSEAEMEAYRSSLSCIITVCTADGFNLCLGKYTDRFSSTGLLKSIDDRIKNERDSDRCKPRLAPIQESRPVSSQPLSIAPEQPKVPPVQPQPVAPVPSVSSPTPQVAHRSRLEMSEEWKTANQNVADRLLEMNRYATVQNVQGYPIPPSARPVRLLEEAEEKRWDIEERIYADNPRILQSIRAARRAEEEYDAAYRKQISFRTHTPEWADAKRTANELSGIMYSMSFVKDSAIANYDVGGSDSTTPDIGISRRKPNGINCNKPDGSVEIVICDSQELLDVEAKLEDAYSAAYAVGGDSVKEEERAWIKSSMTNCGVAGRARPAPSQIAVAENCIMTSVKQRIEELEKIAAN